MIAAISIQVYAKDQFSFHAAKLISGDTLEDILEISRIAAVELSRYWSEIYSLEDTVVTINVELADGRRYYEQLPYKMT